MRELRTILPFALLAALLMVSTSYALPSCCQTGDSSNTSTVSSFWSSYTSGFRAPSAPEPVQNYRPEIRRAAAPAQPIDKPTSARTRNAAKPAPVPRAAASSLPSCCAVDGSSGYQQSASRYYPDYRQVRPQATLGAISSYGGCCGAPVYPSQAAATNLPSCCSTGGSYAGYRGAPAPTSVSNLPPCCSTGGGSTARQYRAAPAPSTSSNLPPCCQVPGGTSAGYKPTASRQNVRAVPASATRNGGNGYYWNTVAGSGPFGKPGYFPTVRSMW